jgi:hypothetical protein
MAKHNIPSPSSSATTRFSDWSPVFTAGEHTDMQGRKKTWTPAELDTLIANLKSVQQHPYTVPVVKGHPATDDPALAWVKALKREGNVLYARFHKVDANFANEVQAGRFPNRSIAIAPSGNGPVLRHVGFLGAALPAVADLPAMFADAEPGNTDDAEPLWLYAQAADTQPKQDEDTDDMATSDDSKKLDIDNDIFDVDDLDNVDNVDNADNDNGDTVVDETADTPSITPADLEAALEAAKQQAANDARQALQAEFTQQQVASKARIVELERERLIGKHQKTIDAAIVSGAITPAQAAGCAEFMAGLEGQQTFCFAANDGAESEVTATAFFAQFVGKLNAGHSMSILATEETAPDTLGLHASRAEIHAKAMAYQRDNECDYVAAVKAVTIS